MLLKVNYVGHNYDGLRGVVSTKIIYLFSNYLKISSGTSKRKPRVFNAT